jgi:hypothetical protein
MIGATPSVGERREPEPTSSRARVACACEAWDCRRRVGPRDRRDVMVQMSAGEIDENSRLEGGSRLVGTLVAACALFDFDDPIMLAMVVAAVFLNPVRIGTRWGGSSSG